MGSIFSVEEKVETEIEDFVVVTELPLVQVKKNLKKPEFDIKRDLLTSALFRKQKFLNSEPLTLQTYVNHALNKKFQNVE
jgi:hypothetical protein